MELKIIVQINFSELFDYRIHEFYMSPVIMIGTVVLCEFFLFSFRTGNRMGVFIAALLLLVSSILCKNKVKKEAKKRNLPEKVVYNLSDKGISVVDKTESFYLWENIQKAFSTRKNIVLWIDKENIILFPRKEIKETQYELVQMISKHISPKKVKRRGAI